MNVKMTRIVSGKPCGSSMVYTVRELVEIFNKDAMKCGRSRVKTLSDCVFYDYQGYKFEKVGSK